jgi:hypothetical protein
MLTINARTHSGEAVQKAPYPGTNLSAKLLNRAGLPQRCPLRVINGKAHFEHLMSGLPPCVDGSELARTFFTFAALVGAPVCSAFRCGSHDRWP